MKKTFALMLISLIALPLSVFAVSEDVCKNGGGTYSAGECTCPTGEEWVGDGCYDSGYSGGGAEETACTGVGGTWNGTTCVCPSGKGWTGSSCYNCGVALDGYTFCGSGCSGYSGCEDDSADGGDTDDGSGGSTSCTGVICNPISSSTFSDLVGRITNWIIDIALVLGPLIIVYGGFTYITAAGDTEKVRTGKKIILYAAVGLLLALLASSLIDILKGLAGG